MIILTARAKNTYLAYITDSEGEFIIGEESFPITANTSFIFSEGIRHQTLGTGLTPRLLLGPMNEFAEPVGSTLVYFSNYDDAINLIQSEWDELVKDYSKKEKSNKQ